MNAALLVPLLVALIRIGSDDEVMGTARNGRKGLVLACAAAAVVALSLVALVGAGVR